MGHSPGGPKFFTTGNIAFPPLAGLANTILHFVGNGSYTLYHAGPKGGFPGPEQLVRFWDIRVVAIGIIQRSHDPGPLLSPTDPNCRVRPGLCKTQKARETRGLHTAMGHGVPLVPIALIGHFGYFSLIGLDCTSSASALNTCTLSPAYPLFGWVTYGLWCYTL